MASIYLLLALLLPLLIGGVWLHMAVPERCVGRQAIILGYGLLIGLMAIPALMRIIDALGFALTFANVASLAVAVVAAGVIANIRCHKPVGTDVHTLPYEVALQNWQKITVGLLCAAIGLRLCVLSLEVAWRPLFPWDASMHWATKAKVWFDAGQIVPFVDNDRWLEMLNDRVFTDRHPAYPKTIPLLQVWMSLAIGRWDESLVNLPWVLCLAGIGLAFYGQARASGGGVLLSIAFTYMLLSMPLVNTHVALAGCADLFLGAFYAGAIMAFHNWSVRKERWQGALAIFMALCCPLIKDEGFYWILTFVPALVVVALPWRTAAVFLMTSLALLVGVLWLFPKDIMVVGHSLDELNLFYRAQALPAILASFLVKGSWHVFGYILIFFIPLGFFMIGKRRARYRPIGVALMSAVLLFLVLFLATKFSTGAVRYTAVSRISLHLVPAFVFLSMLLYFELSSSRHTDPPKLSGDVVN
jgi:hypothetical protein